MARPRTLNIEDRRKDIVDAALSILTQKGYSAVRLDDVARRAGVAKGTLYLYFRDKETLFSDVMTSVVARLDAEIAEKTAGTSGAAELRLVAAAETGFISQYRDFLAQFSFQKSSTLGSPARRSLKSWFSGHIDRVAEVLDRCVSDGSVRPHDTRKGAYFLVALCRMFALHLIEAGRRPTEAQIGELIDFFLNGVGASPRTT